MFASWSPRSSRLPVAALLLVGMSACSTPAIQIPAAMIGGQAFTEMGCEELRAQRNQRVSALNDLNHPPLFPSKSEQERQKEVSQQEGEVKAIEKVEAEKKCAVGRNAWSSHAGF
jgi:hypothetical protein